MLQILSVLRPDDMGSFVFGLGVSSVIWVVFIIMLMFFMSASENGKRMDEIHRQGYFVRQDEWIEDV